MGVSFWVKVWGGDCVPTCTVSKAWTAGVTDLVGTTICTA